MLIEFNDILNRHFWQLIYEKEMIHEKEVKIDAEIGKVLNDYTRKIGKKKPKKNRF